MNWVQLAQCFSFRRPDHTQDLAKAIEKTCSLGAIPFEVIAGTPQEKYGARITFRLPADNAEVLAACGLACHPWGRPDWIGLRINREGRLIAKAYHKLAQISELPFADDFTKKFYPVMSSFHENAIETYLRFRERCEWTEFVCACTESLSPYLPDFQPFPRPVAEAFCMSVRLRDGDIQAISVFADQRSLPDDDTIRQLWSRDMSSDEREAYELTLAGVRSCGPRRFGSWHAMLGWTLESDGVWHRAASLRFPTPALNKGGAYAFTR